MPLEQATTAVGAPTLSAKVQKESADHCVIRPRRQSPAREFSAMMTGLLSPTLGYRAVDVARGFVENATIALPELSVERSESESAAVFIRRVAWISRVDNALYTSAELGDTSHWLVRKTVGIRPCRALSSSLTGQVAGLGKVTGQSRPIEDKDPQRRGSSDLSTGAYESSFVHLLLEIGVVLLMPNCGMALSSDRMWFHFGPGDQRQSLICAGADNIQISAA
jgi:hypothetical protein